MNRSRARGRGVSLNRLADRLHSVAIRLLRRVRLEDVSSGLTGPRLSALSVIVFAGPITPGELAAAEQVRPPTMTKIVRALEGERLVRRKRDPGDGRVVRLSATRKGRALLQAGRARRVRRLAKPLSELSVSQRRTLDAAAGIIDGVIARLS